MPNNKKKTFRISRQRALSVLARMRRRGESLTEAALNEHTIPRTVLKIIGKQLKRNPSGRYSATTGDALRRDITVLGANGYAPLSVRSSMQAQLAPEHLIAVNRFLRTGMLSGSNRSLESVWAVWNCSPIQTDYGF